MLLDYIFALSNIAASGALVYAVDQKFKNDPFAFHPIFAASGASTIFSAAYIMSQSKRIAAAKKSGAWGGPGPLQLHQWAMYAGAASMLYSLRVIYREKEAKGKKHIQTVHSKLGIASVIGVATLALATTGLLKAPEGSMAKETSKTMWNSHMNLGRAGLLALGAAITSGAYSVFGNTPKFQGIIGGLAVAIGAVEYASLSKVRKESS
jgi:hypothetical protein